MIINNFHIINYGNYFMNEFQLHISYKQLLSVIISDVKLYFKSPVTTFVLCN